jgi:hypothetical protein
LIPQAFTTRDMSEAYKWLQTLPASVREEIKSMEQVVSLYLRAKRLGGALPTREEVSSYVLPRQEAVLENSKSGQEFQKTLKNLKHELEQFDFAGGNGGPEGQIPLSKMPSLENFAAPQQASHLATAAQNSQPQLVLPPVANNAANNVVAALRLDPRSRQIVNDIRENLNLSSDVEVIRMSLVLAHRTLKDLLK